MEDNVLFVLFLVGLFFVVVDLAILLFIRREQKLHKKEFQDVFGFAPGWKTKGDKIEQDARVTEVAKRQAAYYKTSLAPRSSRSEDVRLFRKALPKLERLAYLAKLYGYKIDI